MEATQEGAECGVQQRENASSERGQKNTTVFQTSLFGTTAPPWKPLRSTCGCRMDSDGAAMLSASKPGRSEVAGSAAVASAASSQRLSSSNLQGLVSPDSQVSR